VTDGHLPAGLVALVDSNAPFWGAEAEVCRTYFESPARSIEGDLRWLARQAAKELLDGVALRAADLARALEDTRRTNAESLVRVTEELHEEARHFLAFVAAYDHIRPDGTPALEAASLGEIVGWPENVELGALRARHRRDHGELGVRAGIFTEGGYCTLFTEGMRLAGGGNADDAIAAACGAVYEDEVDHMLEAVTDLVDAEVDDDGWGLLAQMTVDQARQRVRMRQAQFGNPVPAGRLAELLASGGEPVPFAWERLSD
jgi:hypothetical protein